MAHNHGKPRVTSNTIHVSEEGGDFSSIASAIAASVAGDVIMVHPGSYTEANPLTMKDSTSLTCPGGHQITEIVCANAGANGLVLPDDSEVRGLRIRGASTAGSAGFVYAAGKDNCELRDCATEDCDIGVLSQATGPANLIRGFSITEGSCTSGIKVPAGAVLGVTDAYIYADAGETITTAYHATGASSALLLNNSFAARHTGTGTLTNGLLIDETGTAEIHGLSIHDATNGVHCGANGCTVDALGVDIYDSVTWDILSDSASTVLTIGGGKLDSTKISRIDGEQIIGYWQEAFPGDLGTSIQGELHVGTPAQPAETVLGEGDSTVISMYVYTDDGTGTAFVDETADATDGTAYNVFQGLTAGHVCYWGNTDRKFPGMKIKTTTAMVLGAGSVVWEISDGAAGWTTMPIMAADSVAPWNQYAQAALQRVSFDQVRWNPTHSTWGTNTVNGLSAYWIRCRIAVGITTGPIVSDSGAASTKLHTNRWECNADGFTERFGDGIKKQPLPLSDRYALTGGGSPASTTMNPSTNITWVDADSGFAAAGDGVVWTAVVPPGLDTSRDITATVAWKPASTDTGGVVMTLYATAISFGDSVPPAGGALPEVNDPNTYTASGVADAREAIQVHSVSLHDVIPGDTIVLSLQRTTAAAGGTPTIETVGRPLIEGYFWR